MFPRRTRTFGRPLEGKKKGVQGGFSGVIGLIIGRGREGADGGHPTSTEKAGGGGGKKRRRRAPSCPWEKKWGLKGMKGEKLEGGGGNGAQKAHGLGSVQQSWERVS